MFVGVCVCGGVFVYIYISIYVWICVCACVFEEFAGDSDGFVQICLYFVDIFGVCRAHINNCRFCRL